MWAESDPPKEPPASKQLTPRGANSVCQRRDAGSIAESRLSISASLLRYAGSCPAESIDGETSRCRSLKNNMDKASRAHLNNSSQHASSVREAPRRCNCTRVYAESRARTPAQVRLTLARCQRMVAVQRQYGAQLRVGPMRLSCRTGSVERLMHRLILVNAGNPVTAIV